MESYKNYLYFGTFTKRPKNMDSIVVNLLFNNVVNLDGTVNELNIGNCKKGELWAYIYYIWKQNSFMYPFMDYNVVNTNHVINSSSLIRLVRDLHEQRKMKLDDKYFTNKDLARVINIVITNNDEINIPIVKQSLNMLHHNLAKEEKDLESLLADLNILTPKLKLFTSMAKTEL